MPTKDWYLDIHERLLTGDPVAPAELWEAVGDRLVAEIDKKWSGYRYTDLAVNAVTDAFVSYVKNPSQYKPSGKGLFGFLYMAAEGDFLNALKRVRKRKEMEVSIEVVELPVPEWNRDIGGEERDESRRQVVMTRTINRIFNDEEDRQAAGLILEGERSTEEFAKIFCLGHLPNLEQRREVKRRKDRIKKRLERDGGENR